MQPSAIPVPDTLYGGWSLDYVTLPDQVKVAVLTCRVTLHMLLGLLKATSTAADLWEWIYDRLLLDPTIDGCLLYTSPSPRDATLSRMPSSA